MSSLLDSPEVQAFRGLSHAYCEIVDRRASVSPGEWMKAVHLVLPALYAAAASLPDVEPDTDADAPQIAHSSTLAKELATIVGNWDLYSLVFDPYEDKEPVMASLGGDLAEIYEDLRNGQHHEAIAASLPNDVVWQWRFDFASHWSRHASTALSALQSALLSQHADQLPETLDRP